MVVTCQCSHIDLLRTIIHISYFTTLISLNFLICTSFYFILTEMLGSPRGKAVKQTSLEVLVSLSTLRITIGNRVLQKSVQWVSV